MIFNKLIADPTFRILAVIFIAILLSFLWFSIGYRVREDIERKKVIELYSQFMMIHDNFTPKKSRELSDQMYDLSYYMFLTKVAFDMSNQEILEARIKTDEKKAAKNQK